MKTTFFMAQKKPTTIRFPEEYKLDLKIQAAKRGMTMEALILEAYKRYISDSAKIDRLDEAPKRKAGGKS